MRIATLLMALAPPALTQVTTPCANPAPGPDLLAAELSSVVTVGSVAGMAAYSLAPTACSVGTSEVSWQGSAALHPVYVVNLHRVANGRFEQIGASWAQHGLFALQMNLCCACTPNPTAAALGVGCSTVSSAFVASNPTTMSPRSEVNASTGGFVWPSSAFGQSGDAVFRRCQVALDDVDAAIFPDARYAFELQFVAADVAQASNGAGGTSWRWVDRTPGPFGGPPNLTESNIARERAPALHAWQEVHPDVALEPIDVDGRLWVAARAFVGASGTTWRYEYCVANVNSHRSVNVFSIAKDASVTVTGLGMSFPHAHSGEVTSNQAWTATDLGDRVEWRAPSFANDPNANAVRWGTTYSFWFESPHAPASRTATLGLFRPGAEPDPTVVVAGPSAGEPQPIVSTYCSALPNSTGAVGASEVTAIDVVARTLDLAARDLPPGALALGLASLDPGLVAQPGGSVGLLCLGGSIGRAPGGSALVVSAAGTLSEQADLDALPQPSGPVAVLPGDTWHFQHWHRDTGAGAATSNFTAPVRVWFP